MQPRKPKELLALFNKFAGKEVPMTERTISYGGCWGGEPMTYTQLEPTNPADPTIAAMHKLAKDSGFSLRLFWEGMGGTDDYRTDRVNGSIEKCADGKYRVSSDFNIG